MGELLRGYGSSHVRDDGLVQVSGNRKSFQILSIFCKYSQQDLWLDSMWAVKEREKSKRMSGIFIC